MVDIAVKSGAAWVCHAEGHRLADVLLPVHIGYNHEEELSHSETDETTWGPPVVLEQTEEGAPCILTLHCSPGSSASISRLLVVSEARTMEVYSQTGEYCGTVRGDRADSVQPDSSDRGPFYRKQLILEHPSSACEVKLLSLAGRNSVSVSRVVVGVGPLQPCPARGPGIDMQQVQCLVDEMGTSLSPGAQNLMDMVHFQQKNQTSSLGGFLPLLVGGGANISPAAVTNTPKPPVGSIRPAGEAPPAQNGATSDSSASSPPDLNTMSSESKAQLAEMMSHFLMGRGHGPALSSGPELLPVLQGVCGQVTKLRLEDAALVAEKETRNGTWEVDSAMERHLEEMERRLKEHVDRRLDALEQKLEKVLLSVLRQGAAAASCSVEEAATGPPEQSATH